MQSVLDGDETLDHPLDEGIAVTWVDELAQIQQREQGPGACMYEVIRDKVDLDPEQLGSRSPELRKLYRQRGAMRVSSDGILEIRMAPRQTPRWCAICPPPLRHSTICLRGGVS